MGEESAWALFLDQWRSRVRAACHRHGLSLADADEALADLVFDLYAAGALARFTPGLRFEPWIGGCIRVVLLRRIRDLGRRIDPGRILTVASIDPLVAAVKSEQHERVRIGICRLPDPERRALHMRIDESRTLKEIAVRLQLSFPMQARRLVDSAIRSLRDSGVD
jgi:DNA-directed RNA polymerase specialized sigma24 family protein